MFTADVVIEGDNGRRVGGKCQIMVRPLAEDRHQMSVERVTLYFLVSCCQDSVGHLSHLRTIKSQWALGFVSILL